MLWIYLFQFLLRSPIFFRDNFKSNKNITAKIGHAFPETDTLPVIVSSYITFVCHMNWPHNIKRIKSLGWQYVAITNCWRNWLLHHRNSSSLWLLAYNVNSTWNMSKAIHTLNKYHTIINIKYIFWILFVRRKRWF